MVAARMRMTVRIMARDPGPMRPTFCHLIRSTETFAVRVQPVGSEAVRSANVFGSISTSGFAF